jgi:hypothetical protein
MAFLLSTQNVLEYLVQQEICEPEQTTESIEPKQAKNFNLLLKLTNGQQFLVKQERRDREGRTAGEFLKEWQFHQSLQKFSKFGLVRPHLSEVLHFNSEDSIIVFNYLADYRDLADFYVKEKVFPTQIAAAIGTSLATIHRTTFQHQGYQDFFTFSGEADLSTRISQRLDRVSPEIFGLVPGDGIKFFALYQRYDSLRQAIVKLGQSFQPCCLTHNDLKLNNILLSNSWENSRSDASLIRLIDWERCAWGDPAFDMGMLIGSYLQLWLSSLVVSQTIAIEEALKLAMVPLDVLQPSILALMTAYLESFPEILLQVPNFLSHVVQFAGLSLIQQIQAAIQYQKTFDNSGICMLQVAKSLLCRPSASIPTVFGVTEPMMVRIAA